MNSRDNVLAGTQRTGRVLAPWWVALSCAPGIFVPMMQAADPAPSPQAGPQRLISLVLLTSEARQHEHSAIVAAATAATGTAFSEDAIQEKPPFHLVRLPAGEFRCNFRGVAKIRLRP